MFTSLFIGASGMLSSELALSVVGNNISNANTTGYKGSSVEFKDMFYEDLVGAERVSMVGKGVKVGAVTPSFSQGSIINTSCSTDLAISGRGFFMVKDPEKGNVYYTRDGSFLLEDYKLVDEDGYIVQGVVYTEGIAVDQPSQNDLDFSSLSSIFKPTSTIDAFINLDATINPSSKVFDINKPEETSDFITNTKIYDASGNPVYIYLAFDKTDVNTWNLYVLKSNNGSFTQVGGPFTIQFTPSGITDQSTVFTFNIDNQSIELDLTGITQFASPSSVISMDQDGYPEGNLENIYVERNGEIIGIYSNGQNIPVGRIALARFSSPWNLERIGDNRFRETSLSGSADLFFPGGYFADTKITGGALETSNVDLANEFVNMILAQRSFQISSRVVSTSDQMLVAAINLKR